MDLKARFDSYYIRLFHAAHSGRCAIAWIERVLENGCTNPVAEEKIRAYATDAAHHARQALGHNDDERE